MTVPLDDIQARCRANAKKAKSEVKSIERARWKPLTAAEEPRVAPSWAKKAPKAPCDESREH